LVDTIFQPFFTTRPKQKIAIFLLPDIKKEQTGDAK
jgi:hypothetical protein